MKKIISLLLAAVLMLSLVACGGGGDTGGGKNDQGGGNSSQDQGGGQNDQGGDSQDQGTQPSPYDVTEPITITFWHSFANEKKAKMVEDAAAAFNESQDMITVEPVYINGSYAGIDTEIIAAQTAGSGLPGLSVINYPRVITYAENGVIEPLQGYIDGTGLDIDAYVDGLVEPCRYKDDVYAMPFAANSSSIYYNQDLLDELKIEIPETWEDLKAMAKAVYEAKGICGFVFTNDANFLNNMLVSTGADPLGDGVQHGMDDPAIKEWIKDFKEQCDLGYMEYLNGKDADATARAGFAGGIYAAAVDDVTASVDVQAMADFTVEVRLPIRYGTAAGGCLIIPAENDQQVKNAAWQFLMFLTNEENALNAALTLNVYPVRKSIIENEDTFQQLLAAYPACDDVYENLDHIISKNKTPYYSKAMGVIKTYFGMIILDDADFDTAYAAMDGELNEIFAGN